MKRLLIKGGTKLNGEVVISGAKNGVLPILIGSAILTTKDVELTNIPNLKDLTTAINLLSDLGVKSIKRENSILKIKDQQISSHTAPYDLVNSMRASILVLGPLLSRFGAADVAMPGGCSIGFRPIDIHLDGLRAMGATINIEHGFIKARAKKRLRGVKINMHTSTVTGTENLIMASVLASGQTVLQNAAQEPEVVDLINFLNRLGAKIRGGGSSTILIDGVKKLAGGQYRILSDRIEAGTYLVAVAMSGGWIKIKNIDPQIMQIIIDKLRQAGADIVSGSNFIELSMKKSPQAVDIVTATYPGFPTDMQAQMVALNSISKGRGVICETIFENRFRHVQELQRMGADLKIEGNIILSKGVERLLGAPVMATDLRASASLVLAAIVAEGETIISRIHHIDRGYENIEEKLKSIGAEIYRI